MAILFNYIHFSINREKQPIQTQYSNNILLENESIAFFLHKSISTIRTVSAFNFIFYSRFYSQNSKKLREFFSNESTISVVTKDARYSKGWRPMKPLFTFYW